MGPWLQVEREIALHSRLRHRNIVALHGHFADREHVYLVLEYCGRQVPQGLGGEGAPPPGSSVLTGQPPPPGLLGLSVAAPMSLRTYLSPPGPHQAHLCSSYTPVPISSSSVAMGTTLPH